MLIHFVQFISDKLVKIIYYRLNICVPLEFIHWNLIPDVMVFGRIVFRSWLDHKGRVLMNGISAIIIETPEISLALSTKWGYRGWSWSMNMKADSYWIGWHLHLGPSSFLHCNKFLMFISHGIVPGILL